MNLATEMLHEIKMTARRWFIIAIIELVIIIAIVIGFLWYISLPTDLSETIEQTVDQDADIGDNSFIGGDYIGETNNKNTKNQNN